MAVSAKREFDVSLRQKMQWAYLPIKQVGWSTVPVRSVVGKTHPEILHSSLHMAGLNISMFSFLLVGVVRLGVLDLTILAGSSETAHVWDPVQRVVPLGATRNTEEPLSFPASLLV